MEFNYNLRRLYSIHYPPGRKKIFSFTALLFFAFVLPGLAFSQATVATDKLDYPPGDTVLISGTGFSPMEEITLLVTHMDSGLVITDSVIHEPWQVFADADGNFFSSWIIPLDGDEAGALLKLTADGNSSGLHAEVFFTDAVQTKISGLSPFQNSCGVSTVTVQALLEYKSGPNYFPLVGKTVNFTLGASTGSGVTNASGIATAVISLPVSASSLVASFAGDGTYNSSNNSLTFIINKIPVINSYPTGGNSCVNSSFSFVVLATGSPSPTYQWKKNNVPISGANGPTYSIGSSTTSHAGYYSVDVSNICGTVSSPPVELVVNPVPIISANPLSQLICSGDAISTITLNSDIVSSSYKWLTNAPGGTTVTPASGSGDINCVITNTTGTLKTVTFTIIDATPEGCSSQTTATVSVKPIPNSVATPVSQTVCSGTAISTIVLSGGFSGTTYEWSRNNTSNLTGIAASGSGNISGTLTNATTLFQPVLFTIIPSANGCAGEPVTATVNVNTLPFVSSANLSADNTTGDCGTNLSFSSTVSGSPAPAITYNISGSPISSPWFFPVGITHVNIASTNICGTAYASFTATVSDIEIPAIQCNETVYANTYSGSCSATVSLSSPVASDNCSVSTLVSDHPSSSFPVGTTIVTWTATDVNGNINTCEQDVVVTDNGIPAIICGGTINANTDPGSCTATVSLPDPTAIDNCAVASVVNDHPSSSFSIGTTIVTWTATDVNGNTNTCTQNVFVTDNEIPSISCSGTINANTEAGSCSATISLSEPVASDNCSVASLVNNHASSSFPIGTTIVTWTATDVNGNTNTCTQNVVVTDNEIPSIICGETITADTDLGSCSATVLISDPTTSDNCFVALLGNDYPSSSFPVGTTIVTWTATDVNGNTNTCTQNIVVIDNEIPSITCAGTINANTDSGSCFTSVLLSNPSIADNCFVALLGSDHISPAFPVGTTVVTWTATDINGNTNTCTQNVVITDIEIPSIICGGTINANTDPGSCSATVLLTDPVVDDNCFVALLGSDHIATAFPVGTTLVTWTATDINGNANTCTQNVVVIDNQNPVISGCPSNIILPTCVSTAEWTSPGATDNCSATISSTHNSGDSFQIGTTTVIYTATDPYSNTKTCSFTVTRLPALSESAVVANNSYWNACNGSATVTAGGGQSPYTYSKDETAFQSSNILAGLCEGTYPLTVKDANGCLISVSSEITQPAYQCGNLSEYTDADIGGWGAAPNGGNIANVWLYPYFSQVYPNGVSIGSGDKIITFNSACAVSNWLPAGGTSRQLDFTGALLTNPLNGGNTTCTATGTTYQNTLASKVLALTLNIDFDKTLPNFNQQFTITYGDLIYTAAPFIGWKVSEILFEANKLLGQGAAACGQTNSYYSTMTDVISNVIKGTNTRCPNLQGKSMLVENSDSLQSMHVIAYPNPFSTSFTIEFTSPEDGLVSVTIYSITGEVVATLFNETVKAGETNEVVFNGENYAQGIYIYKLTAGDKLYFDRMILSR